MQATPLSNQTEPYILDGSAKVSTADGDIYRLAQPFTFETGGLADEITIQTAALGGRFAPHEYTLASSALSSLKHAVLVTLPLPHHVRRVRVQGSALDDASQKLALHRVDVEAITDEPTIKVSNNATLTDDFSDLRFAIYRDGSQDLEPSQVELIRVCSDPAGPRLGLAVDGDLENIVYFWQGTAEIENVDLAGTLDRFLNRRLAELAEQGQAKPDQIEATLLFESSAPCELEIDQLAVDYRLVVNSWTASLPERDSEKKVLRLRGDRVDSHSLYLVLPHNATIHQATLQVVESQAGGPLKTGPAGSEGAVALSNPFPTEKSGLRVGTEHWIAQTIELTAALTASSLALALMPLREGTELRVALQESWHDRPSGNTLAEGTLELSSPGKAIWATLPLPQALTLSTQPYWLMLRAAEGQAVWLAHSGAGTAKIWQQPEGQGTWRPVRDLSGHQLLFQFLAPRLQALPAAAEAEGAPIESTCRVTVGGQEVPPNKRTGDTVEYDITGGLNAYLATISAEAMEAGADISIPLAFSALGLKQLTVFPPKIEYAPEIA